jgi:hypothetical protein
VPISSRRSSVPKRSELLVEQPRTVVAQVFGCDQQIAAIDAR